MNHIRTTKLKVADLRLNPKNPRFIRDAKYKALVTSIKNFPQMLKLRPIVVDENLLVLGGNYRVRALREAGVTEVDCTIAEGLTEKQKREFIIKDNVSYGEWDEDALEDWDTTELADWDIDIEEDDGGTPMLDEQHIEPFKKTHVLLSFPPERLIDIQDLLEQLQQFDFIEFEQASN